MLVGEGFKVQESLQHRAAFVVFYGCKAMMHKLKFGNLALELFTAYALQGLVAPEIRTLGTAPSDMELEARESKCRVTTSEPSAAERRF